MAKNTIAIKSYANIQEEFVAAAAITPGELVAMDSDGKVGPHAIVGGQCACMFALEDFYQGKKITEDYAADDRVICQVFQRGEVAYAIAEGDSTSEGVTVGDLVGSAGDGTLRTFTKGSVDSVAEDFFAIGEALETVEGGQRFMVRIY